jgi:hypothetical protein
LSSGDEEKIEILNEFATEAMVDFTLKNICFTSREVFMVLFEMYDDLLTPPPPDDYISYRVEQVAMLAMTPVARRGRVSRDEGIQGESDPVRQQYVEQRILSRLKVTHAILKVVVRISTPANH